MFDFGFVVEHVLGHITHYQNLKHWVTPDTNVHPIWMPIEADQNDIWTHLLLCLSIFPSVKKQPLKQ